MNETDEDPVGFPNVRCSTLGGQQFWEDVHYRAGWKIQHNVFTGHFRLIDPLNFRLAWGNQAHCRQKLNEISLQRSLPWDRGHIVILLHGLIRTHHSMQRLRKYLLKSMCASVINFEYASTRGSLEMHAKALGSLVESLSNQVTRIDFVGHSMGNIVVRRYLFDVERTATESTSSMKSKFGRMVMIAPPNQGSRMARLLNRSFLFNMAVGESGVELGRGWERLKLKLSTPFFPFAIMAGGKENERLIDNWFLAGANDFTVGVEETKLAGAADFRMLPYSHTFIIQREEVFERVARFLECGFLETEETRTPIPQRGAQAAS